MSGGQIKCASVEGDGSTFTVDLFFEKAQAVEPEPSAVEVTAWDVIPFIGMRCLFCEDNSINQRIGKTMLERLGFKADIASDGMFDEYGWEVPTTFDDFVALCLRIREDTDGAVQSWNPNAKYDSVLSVAIEAFVYEELFGGKDNRIWYNAFCNGEATFAGHMEPLYEVVQTLIDNEILREEHFNYSATTRGKDFQNGLLAMFNGSISRMSSDKYEFAYMPYPTTSGESGYVSDAFSSMLCVPKKDHTDTETDALNRFLTFFSSVEGQQALIGNSLMVSNVKGVSLSDSALMAGIEEVISKGHLFSCLDFPGPGARTWTIQSNTLAMITEGKNRR